MAKDQHAPGALEAVRAFVNTLDVEAETDALGSPEALVGWLRTHDLLEVEAAASGADLGNALALREALRAILLTHNGAGAVPADAGAALDAAARRAQLVLRFDADARARLEPQADGVDAAVGRLLAIVEGAIADGTWPRLKACREHTCAWAFYDHTKNRSGAWCNMAVCGNRAKARAFRERRGGGGGPRAPRLRP